MRQDGFWMIIQDIDATFHQVTSVQVVMGGHLEEFTASLLGDELVVRAQTYVVRLTNVPDPGILFCVSPANVGRVIG